MTIDELITCRRILINNTFKDTAIIEAMMRSIKDAKISIPDHTYDRLMDRLDELIDTYFDGIIEQTVKTYKSRGINSMEIFDITNNKSYVFESIEQYAMMVTICDIFVYSQIFKSFYKLI